MRRFLEQLCNWHQSIQVPFSHPHVHRYFCATIAWLWNCHHRAPTQPCCSISFFRSVSMPTRSFSFQSWLNANNFSFAFSPLMVYYDLLHVGNRLLNSLKWIPGAYQSCTLQHYFREDANSCSDVPAEHATCWKISSNPRLRVPRFSSQDRVWLCGLLHQSTSTPVLLTGDGTALLPITLEYFFPDSVCMRRCSPVGNSKAWDSGSRGFGLSSRFW